jgi:two-component sensor histidine kinase
MMAESSKTEFAPLPSSGRRAFFVEWAWISFFCLLIALASLLGASWFSTDGIPYWWRPVATQWLPWILFTPVIIWLTAAFTIERASWYKNVWVHLLACLMIVGGLGSLSYLVLVRPYLQKPAPLYGSTGNQSFAPGGRGSWPDTARHSTQTNNLAVPAGGWPSPWGWPGAAPSGGPPQWAMYGYWPWQGWGNTYYGTPGGNPFPVAFDMKPPPAVAIKSILGLSILQLPAFWAVLGIAHAFLFYQRVRVRERRGLELESRLNQARLQALRMQINPHFLFNTLNSISSLVYDKPRVADEMITSLSDLLRLTLNTSERQEVTLREELDLLDQYLFIEQTRFGDRLKIGKDIEPATLDTTMPSLLLQPLVENAFKHGVEAQLGPAVINISAKRSGNKLLLEIADNGRGVPADGPINEGVGLSNIRARLKGLYSDQASMDCGPRASGGFRVIVQIPWRANISPAVSGANT